MSLLGVWNTGSLFWNICQACCFGVLQSIVIPSLKIAITVHQLMNYCASVTAKRKIINKWLMHPYSKLRKLCHCLVGHYSAPYPIFLQKYTPRIQFLTTLEKIVVLSLQTKFIKIYEIFFIDTHFISLCNNKMNDRVTMENISKHFQQLPQSLAHIHHLDFRFQIDYSIPLKRFILRWHYEQKLM